MSPTKPTFPYNPPASTPNYTISSSQGSKPYTLFINRRRPTPLTQQHNIKLPDSPNPKITNFIVQTNGLLVNPRNFPMIFTPLKKPSKKIQ